jgi:hypothetical protein
MKRILLSLLVGSGLISAQAAQFTYSINFSDVGEAQASPATGSGTAIYDDVAHSLTLSASFSGLLGPVTQSHIHVSPTPFSGSGGIAVTSPSLPGFPTGGTSGTYNNTLDLTLNASFNATYLANNGGTAALAESAFAAHVAAGRAYWNIHTSFGPGGEIRGFLTVVPEPSTLAMLSFGAAALVIRGRQTGRK